MIPLYFKYYNYIHRRYHFYYVCQYTIKTDKVENHYFHLRNIKNKMYQNLIFKSLFLDYINLFLI
jgi:hypothetical protein